MTNTEIHPDTIAAATAAANAFDAATLDMVTADTYAGPAGRSASPFSAPVKVGA